MRFVWIFVLACAEPRAATPVPPKPRAELSTTQWTERCRQRIDLARLALVRLDDAFAEAAIDIDTSPWNPGLRFEARRGSGYWQAHVEHGRGPCIDFDVDDPEYNNMPWRDGTSVHRVAVDRIMRMDGDEAWLQAAHVPEQTAIAFRRELQRALRECLVDARGVALADPPAGMCNGGADDRCPDEPNRASEEGCPEPVAP
jgi:hypothetical protein